MHRLLKRQIKKVFGKHFDISKSSPEFQNFIKALEDSYLEYEKEVGLIDRALSLSSKELNEANEKILSSNIELEEKVKEKTKELEETIKRLEQAKIAAERANRAKSVFLAGMSHEIRTPLNAIIGFIDLLEEGESNPKKRGYIQIVKKSALGLTQIINDILDFSKIESGKLEIEKINFNIKEEFDSTIELFKAKCLEKDIQLISEMSSSVPKEIISDPLRIKQIISNLLSNAIKFTENGKKIILSIDYKDEYLFISVQDEGIGISKEHQEKIFKSFSQADSSTTRKFGGSGLGLAISKSLVKLLGGNGIEVESQVGVGSKFSFKILAPSYIPTTKDNINSQNITHITFSGKVLLVEDNAANQMLMKIILKKLGLTPDVANDGLEAIKAFEKNRYDLILMDENMPNLNGTQAASKIIAIEQAKNLKHTPIIALTANALKDDKKRFLDAGMDGYLAKPIEKKEFIKILSKFL